MPFSAVASPTPVPGIDFAVTVVYPTATPAPTFLETPPLVTPTLALTETTGPAAVLPLTNTTTVTAPVTAAAPTATPLLTPTVAAETALTSTTPLTPTAPPPAPLALLEPVPNFTLQPGINELEFKWRWAAQTSCQPPEGFGYELRIWPAVSGYGPMGVTDAVANQQDFHCQPKSNVASYRVDDLKGTPGVSAMGSGKFLWDVAYIQLDPYTVIYTSGPRLFEMP